VQRATAPPKAGLIRGCGVAENTPAYFILFF
jgi:hypothetical protein